MVPFALITLSFTVGMFVLSLIFKIAGKLRLTIPLLYFLVAIISTFFTDWTSKHETLVLAGLFVLIGLVVLSWIVSLVRVIRQRQSDRFLEEDVAWQISRAREKGISLDEISFDESGSMIYKQTGEPVGFGK